MSKSVKIWLIISASLILVGCIIFVGVMMALNWDFTKLSTNQYETNKYAINEEFKNISILSDTADIEFLPSENSEILVVCYEQPKIKHSVEVKDDTLKIEVKDTRRWYEFIGISFGNSKITVYLPKWDYNDLLIKQSTGDAVIPKEFKFESINVSQSTGNVICSASANGDVKIKTSTGDITVENVTVGSLKASVSTGEVNATDIECVGNFTVKVSTGKAKLTNVKCNNFTSKGDTGDITLKNVIANENISLERSTGNVKLDGVDAKELNIQTDTGDVKGSLLSDKVFIAKTDTGSVKVPETTTGGKCKITTDTGNIKIEIKK